MTWHQNQQQLGNIWECCNRSPKHESHWGPLSQIRLEKMNETTKQIQLVDDIPILYSLFVGQIPIFPAWLTQLQWLLEGKLLKHFALLQGFSWPMSQVWWDKSHGDLIRMQWGYRQKSAVALSKKFHTTFYGNFKWENDISNCWMEWGMSLTHSNPRNDFFWGSNFHATLWTILAMAMFQGCYFQD